MSASGPGSILAQVAAAREGVAAANQAKRAAFRRRYETKPACVVAVHLALLGPGHDPELMLQVAVSALQRKAGWTIWVYWLVAELTGRDPWKLD